MDEERSTTLAEYEDLSERPMQVLGLIWLALLILELTSGIGTGLETLTTVIWGLFVVDVNIRLWLTPSKLRYLRRNWLTVASLALPALRFVRLAGLARYALALRASRGARLLRVVASLNRGMATLRTMLAGRAFGMVSALTAVVILGGAAGMAALEGGTPGFEGYGSSVWWTAMLVTGLGSEAWPVTPEGRVLAFLIALYGLAVFGYVASILTSFFLGRDVRDDGPSRDRLAEEVAALRNEIRSAG